MCHHKTSDQSSCLSALHAPRLGDQNESPPYVILCQSTPPTKTCTHQGSDSHQLMWLAWLLNFSWHWIAYPWVYCACNLRQVQQQAQHWVEIFPTIWLLLHGNSIWYPNSMMVSNRTCDLPSVRFGIVCRYLRANGSINKCSSLDKIQTSPQ